MAATLAFGEGAVVSHRSAAQLWELLSPRRGPVDVTVRGYSGRSRRHGLRLHRTLVLPPSAVTRRHGIPVTRPEWTIASLRGSIPSWELRRAIRQAEILGLLLDKLPSDPTRSDLERDFLRICRRHGLPMPAVNVRLGPYLVDFLWRGQSLAVETDAYRYHRGQQAFRDDRRRDLELRARGFEVIRLSEEQVSGEPERVAEILREVLASGRHRVGADGAEETR
jgi:very-short-patch-repair endonuclease